jgi:hypothetical protein
MSNRKTRSKSTQKKEYCESIRVRKEDILLLEEPVIFTTKSIHLPYARPQLRKQFTSSFLNESKMEWKVEWLNIDYSVSNYDEGKMDYYLNDNCNPRMDFYWFQRQLHYCQSLSKEEVLTVRGYTYRGDKILNQWMVSPSDWWTLFIKLILKADFTDSYFPFFYSFIYVLQKDLDYSHSILSSSQKNILNKIYTTDRFKRQYRLSDVYDLLMTEKENMTDISWKEFWNLVITIYRDQLNQIIRKAPTLHHCLTVYRGTKDPYWLKSLTEDHSEFIFKNYTSTSLDIKNTEEFRNESCCLLKITLPEKTPCLFISGFSSEPSEAEILLSSNGLFIQDPTYGSDLLQTRPYFLESGTNAVSSLCHAEEKVQMSFLTYRGYQL